MTRGGPLAGVRVIEITKVWAGPYAGKLLAFLGAEVIKIESRAQLDEMRAYGGVDIDSAPYFLSINQEVLSTQLNMKSAEGVALLKRLIATADIVLDNLRPEAMKRLGLGYDDLRRLKRDIIQVSIKMYGEDGPLGHETGYAPCFAALGGLNHLVGHEGEPPAGMNIRYGDSTVGAAAAFAAIAALHHRERTGEGQFVDVSAVETMSSLIGDSLFACGLTGKVPSADGNAHAEMSPHGCYPCANGEWISIAVAADEEWRDLAAELGIADGRFDAASARLSHRAEIDRLVASITAAHEAQPLALRLRARGVAAFRSQSSLDLVGDEFLWARGAFREVTDSTGRARPIVGPSWRMTPDEASIARGAPLLGEHNDYVYREIAGLSKTEFDDLIARKVID